MAYPYGTTTLGAATMAAPQVQYAAPQVQYAAPQVQYSAPVMQYAAPQTTYATPSYVYRSRQLPSTGGDVAMAKVGGNTEEVEVTDVQIIKVVSPNGSIKQSFYPPGRLTKPHNFFPFDIFGGWCLKDILQKGEQLGLDEELVEELSYVRDHCMMPPFPWGHVMYRSYILGEIIQGDIPGDFAELGIGQGGTSVFFARLAKKFDRNFLAVDSFEGLPPPDMTNKDNHYFVEGDYRPPEGIDQLAQFMKWKSKFDVEDSLFVEKCFFKDLVIPKEFDKFAFVHLDSDLYDSVYDSLELMWDRISPGGCVAIDDFFHHAQGPARAVSDFFRRRGNPKGEPPLLYVVPTYAVLIIKGQSAFIEKPMPSTSSSAPQRRHGAMHSPKALDGNYYSFKMVRMCKPFIKAIEASVARATAACQQEGLSETAKSAINRTRINAAAFLEFLQYPDNAARSGADILRYLWPLEDQWDISQGTLCGLSGEARKTIEIGI